MDTGMKTSSGSPKEDHPEGAFPRGWLNRRRGRTALVLGAFVVTALAVGRSGDDPATDPPTTEPAQIETVPPGGAVLEAGVLVDLGGVGKAATQPFTTPDHWSLHWSYDCSQAGDGGGTFAVTPRGPGNLASVSRSEPTGAGVERYDTPGTFTLEISSPCPWTVKVTEG